MPKLTATELIRAAGTSAPGVIFLCGEDSEEVARTEKRLTRKLAPGSELADTVFDGQALDLTRLEDACAFCPMFADRNLIVIRDLDPDSFSAKQSEEFLRILRNLPENATVLVSMRTLPTYEVKRGAPVFSAKYKKYTTFFEKQGALCVCEKKTPAVLGQRLEKRAAESGGVLERRLAQELASRCACDSALAERELDKLLACAAGQPITKEMLDDLVTTVPESNIFALARAVTSRNAEQAFGILNDLTAKSEDTGTILGLLSVLSGAFLDMYRAKAGSLASKTIADIARDFGYPKAREFAVRNAARDCAGMTTEQLRTCVEILRDTDRAIKSSRTPPRLLLETAIVRMLHVDRGGAEAGQ